MPGPDGLVRIALKRPFSDGTVAVDMDPLSLLCRVAAIVPAPRFHMVRYSGVLASASKWRPLIIPKPLPGALGDAASPGAPESCGPPPPCDTIHNFIEFIASGRATAALGDALAQAEEQVKTLTADVTSMEAAREHVFTPPPRAWIAERVRDLNRLLAERTEKSALELRLTGPVTLTPEKPDIGRPYFRVASKLDALNLLQVADGVRIYCDGGGAGNRTRVREASNQPSFTCVVATSLATGFANSAAT